MTSKSKKLLTVVALLAVGVAGNLFYQRHDSQLRDVARTSVDWPSVSGMVTHSELEAQRSPVAGDKKIDFDIKVFYEYVIDNHLYRNDVVRFDQWRLSNNRKELLVSTYPVGKRVEVFYNPDDPDQAVLVRGSYDPPLLSNHEERP
jgi:hypothetical protein